MSNSVGKPSTGTREAVDYYHELLRREHAATTHEQLSKAIQDGGMMFLGRPICEVLRPFFIGSTTYEAVRQAASLVARGLTELACALAVQPALRDALGLTPKEEALVQLDPGVPTEPVGRFDGFLGADGEVRFVEYNPMPAGLVSGDELRQVYAGLPIMAAFQQRYRTRSASTSERICDALLRTHHRKGGTGRPTIAVLSQRSGAEPDSSSLLELDEMTKLVGIVMSAGFEVQIVDPRQLTFEGGRLRAGDFAIDIAVVDDWPSFVAAVPPDAPFWQAVQRRATWILNSAATEILRGSKSVFALLSDPAYHHMFDAEVAAALVRHVPWTRRVRACQTTYRGEVVDLLPFLANHRDDVVLKPADEYGAKGVVLGWQCDDAAWTAALDRAVAKPYVVQERVSIGSELFPTFEQGKLQFDTRHFTMDPFVWNDTEIHGAYIRLSKSEILNLSAGGGSNTPMVIVEDGASGPG